ncbi:N-acetylmuramoyl-L-alanine amidase [Sphaerisporangium sp. NPDC049002]|uniref:N-acetylmuramoyl-L-alanine amidase n=1 Tax=Sphaerisporangium sp. NPDC049002 TaxID=3155392 RepID=UPI0033EFC66E
MKTVQARHYHRGRLRPVRLVIVHDMEWAETPTTAEDCARMFATMDREASAHVCVDNNSAVRCVADADTAWAAPGANADGLQLEMAGFARQSRAEWLDDYSTAMLGQAAQVVAAWCVKYGIPVKRLSLAEVKAGKRGIIGHVDATRAYGGSHTDPGSGFPWDVFLDLVKQCMKGDTPSKEPSKSWTENVVNDLPTLRPGDENWDVKTLRWLLGARGYPPKDLLSKKYDDELKADVVTFQAGEKLDPDSIVGEKTWGKLLRR